MNKKVILAGICLVLMLFVMTGCANNHTTESETEVITETEKITETIETEPVETETEAVLKEYQSDVGYAITYDSSVFTYTRKADYDELALKGKTFSAKTPVFFSAIRVRNMEVADTLGQLFTEARKEIEIGMNAYEAVCEVTQEAIDNGKGTVTHALYLVYLMNGDAILFEVQWYEDETHTEYEAMMKQMIESLTIQEAVRPTVELPETELVTESEETEAVSSEIETEK